LFERKRGLARGKVPRVKGKRGELRCPREKSPGEGDKREEHEGKQDTPLSSNWPEKLKKRTGRKG